MRFSVRGFLEPFEGYGAGTVVLVANTTGIALASSTDCCSGLMTMLLALLLSAVVVVPHNYTLIHFLYLLDH